MMYHDINPITRATILSLSGRHAEAAQVLEAHAASKEGYEKCSVLFLAATQWRLAKGYGETRRVNKTIDPKIFQDELFEAFAREVSHEFQHHPCP